jgi:hypothetical protein
MDLFSGLVVLFLDLADQAFLDLLDGPLGECAA